MITYLNFKSLGNIELAELTNNTIILFNNRKYLFKFLREMEYLIQETTLKGECKDIDYALADDKAEDVNIQLELHYDHLARFDIDNGEQKITISTELSSVLLVQDVKDLWFVDKIDEDNWEIYALTHFEEEVVNRYREDNIRLIKAIAQGKFGCYENYGL
jgi:hypothetical protein